MKNDPLIVQPGSQEEHVIREEMELLATVQRSLAEREFREHAGSGEYDRELLSLRDQIAEARIEDVAPLVAEMYRLQALGQRAGNGRSIPVDAQNPYFGHLLLRDGKRTRHVLIGNSSHVPTGGRDNFAIVDWRHAPVSRIYYRYEEGDDFEESFGGRPMTGEVLVRRTVSIQEGELKRVTWARGAVARRSDGTWVRLSIGERPTLRGGAGTALRPPMSGEKVEPFKPGQLGVVGDESLREDKRLQAITGLIDKHQFDLITKPDSGIVILQGGAGSGKTTVALHRAAYLHYQNPQVFSPKKMLVVVRSPALTEYIARVLPALGVPGLKVITLQKWMQETRKKVLPHIKRPSVEEVPPAVSRLKKHPGVMKLLEHAVEEEANLIRDDMVEAVGKNKGAKKAVVDKWEGLARLALLPRIREMSKWVESPHAERAGVTAKLASEIAGVLRRARGPAGDVESTWALVLTDAGLVRGAVDAHDGQQWRPNAALPSASGGTPAGPHVDPSAGKVSDQEIAELVAWVGMQAEEMETPDEEDEEDQAADDEEARENERERRTHARREAESELGYSERGAVGSNRSSDAFDDEEENDEAFARSVGVDGRHVDEGSAHGKLDEHDDALLLRLVQLKHGSLAVPGSQKTIAYEHIVVDEAQDLSPTDVAVLRGALTKRESMTLAGDTSQKLVFDNSFTDWKDLLEDLGITGLEIEPLRISYRSTREVMSFARHVLGPLADPVEPVAPRTGAAVEHFSFGTTGEALAMVGEALRSLVLREKKASVAVISRYGAHADMYYDGLRNAEVPSLRRVYGKDFSFAPGIDVVDVAQIKGLEYDYVVLVEVNESTYPDGVEARHLLHIAATRAVYQLWVTSVGKPSPLLPPEA